MPIPSVIMKTCILLLEVAKKLIYPYLVSVKKMYIPRQRKTIATSNK